MLKLVWLLGLEAGGREAVRFVFIEVPAEETSSASGPSAFILARMNRIFRILAILVYLVGVFSVFGAARPNILIILSDDMGFSDLGCYGSEIATPNLDALAKGGLRFTQFYNTARCCPTRAALLTGLYSHQAGVGHMTDDWSPRAGDSYAGDLSPRAVTIAEVLRPAGYRNYTVGKWHVTKHTKPDGPKHNWPLQRGFDRFYGTIIGAGSFYDPGALTRDNTMISPFADPEYKPARFYYTDALTDHAVRFLAEHRRDHAAEPFFMYVAYTAAHWPMHALEEDIAKYRGKFDGGYEPVRAARFAKLRELGLIDPQWKLTPQAGDWSTVKNKPWEARCMEVYAAMVDRMDQGIGRVVAELKRQGAFENTLIFFLHDNGGCAEVTGRNGSATRSDTPTLEPIAADAIRLDVIPKQTRAGFPVLQGTGVMPGPEDTFIAYGRGWANVSNTPFREYKHWVHEGGVSTPLIVSWPARLKDGGKLTPQPGHLVDLMATCADVAGAAYPKTFSGHDITPLAGESLAPIFDGKTRSRGPIFWEHEGNKAIRDGKWKLVAKHNQPWELYDMERDRTETSDLASSEPKKVQELAAKWDAWAKMAGVVPWEQLNAQKNTVKGKTK